MFLLNRRIAHEKAACKRLQAAFLAILMLKHSYFSKRLAAKGCGFT